MAGLQNAMKFFSCVAPEIKYGGRKPGYAIEILLKSGPFTKPCTKFTRLYILMRFSTVLMIRHSIVTLLSTDDDETSPTIQDGGRPTGTSPRCIFRIDLYETTGHSILHCDDDPWKHGSSTWHHVFTCYRSKVITASGFVGAILIYVREYTKSWSVFNPNRSARLDYVEIGRKVLVITATQVEIQTFPFFRRMCLPARIWTRDLEK